MTSSEMWKSDLDRITPTAFSEFDKDAMRWSAAGQMAHRMAERRARREATLDHTYEDAGHTEADLSKLPPVNMVGLAPARNITAEAAYRNSLARRRI